MKFRDYVNEGIAGKFGKAGWLSNKPISDFWPEGPETDMQYLMMDINQELMAHGALNTKAFMKKMTDIRVDVKADKQGKLMVQYPMGVHTDKKLQDIYKKIVAKHIKAI